MNAPLFATGFRPWTRQSRPTAGCGTSGPDIHARDTTGAYGLDRFRAGEFQLHLIEAAEIGDISGKRVLHLQCHIGTDTLCLAARGAEVTGLDFSEAALNCARRLADETGLKAKFVHGTVDEAPRLTPNRFDLVYTTWGTICWLPDVAAWAKVVASVLKPGGELYFADAHPGFLIMEEELGRLVPTYDFQTPADRPLEFVERMTYTGDPTVLAHQSTWVWFHSLSAVLGALIDAGLTIVMFHEHDHLPWQGLPMLTPASDRTLAPARRPSTLSAVLLAAGKEGADEAWAAAHVDEDYQNEQWGVDAEASARREARWRAIRGGGDNARCDAQIVGPPAPLPISWRRSRLATSREGYLS